MLASGGSSASSVSGSSSYLITDLGTLAPGLFSFAYGINNVGQAVGASGHAAVLFEGGHVVDLGTVGCPVTGGDDIASDINDAGQVVGTTCYDVGRPLRAFLWENGTMTDLGTLPGGTWASAWAINEAGQIAGTSELVPPYEYHAVTWQDGAITDLGTLPRGTISQAYDINDMGQVVGFSDNPGERPILWENGKMTDLGSLSGSSPGYAYGINNRGQVVGVSWAAVGDACCWRHAFLWEGGTMKDLGTLGGPESEAQDINDAGQIVGTSYDASGARHAFLWENGTMTDLGTLPGPGDTQSVAYAINDASEIVGTSIGLPYGYRAVLWVRSPAHDVAVTSAAADPLSGTIGTRITISAVVENHGSESETFDVHAFAGSILVGTQTVVDLGPGGSERLSFTWDTASVPPQLRRPGSFSVKVVADPVPQENDLANNEHAAGTVVLYGWMMARAEPTPAGAELGPTASLPHRMRAGQSPYASPLGLGRGTIITGERASGVHESFESR